MRENPTTGHQGSWWRQVHVRLGELEAVQVVRPMCQNGEIHRHQQQIN